MLHSFFSVHEQGPGTYLSSCFLSVLLRGQPEQQSPLFDGLPFFFFVDTIYQSLRSGRIWHKVNFLSGV